MEPAMDLIHAQLHERRERLATAAAQVADRGPLDALVAEVDAALARAADGTYGVCEVCHTDIGAERLLSDPLVRVCLDCLPPAELRALERDLETAARIQAALLPPASLRHGPWESAYRYVPARHVSGDYCDLVPGVDGRLCFMLGDVAGKGIAASMVMTQLHAMFRTLMPLDLPLAEIVGRAGRLLCESTLASHYATLVCGTIDAGGALAICNAGHPAALLLRPHGIVCLESTGLPLGMFCAEQYGVTTATLEAGDTLVIYTDGVTEAANAAGEEFGMARLREVAARHRTATPSAFIDACLAEVAAHRGPAPAADDVTIMAIRRAS
jgi:sigma-B regulation protein RsbU (phosphoserine phosphatase)